MIVKDFNIPKRDWKKVSKDVEDSNNKINKIDLVSMYHIQNDILFEYTWNGSKNILEIKMSQQTQRRIIDNIL